MNSKLDAITPWINSWASCGAHTGLAVGIWKNNKEIYYGDANHKDSNMINRDALY